jgi:hypothetical protein
MIYINKNGILLPISDEEKSKISIHSHNIYDVSCDFKVSKKCRNTYKMEFRFYCKYIKNNNGKLPCIYCSREIKFSGRNNPNTKYKSLDDNFFL